MYYMYATRDLPKERHKVRPEILPGGHQGIEHQGAAVEHLGSSARVGEGAGEGVDTPPVMNLPTSERFSRGFAVVERCTEQLSAEMSPRSSISVATWGGQRWAGVGKRE